MVAGSSSTTLGGCNSKMAPQPEVLVGIQVAAAAILSYELHPSDLGSVHTHMAADTLAKQRLCCRLKVTQASPPLLLCVVIWQNMLMHTWQVSGLRLSWAQMVLRSRMKLNMLCLGRTTMGLLKFYKSAACSMQLKQTHCGPTQAQHSELHAGSAMWMRISPTRTQPLLLKPAKIGMYSSLAAPQLGSGSTSSKRLLCLHTRRRAGDLVVTL